MSEIELGPPAFWLLIAAGALSGAGSLWVFQRWTNGAELRVAINRMLAHLLEFRLFADEPGLLIKAQLDLLAANGRLLRRVAVPSLLLVLPFALVLVAMDAMFGRAPLPPGHATVVTVQCTSRGTGLPAIALDAPAGISVETPPVRAIADSQISWRIRPSRAVSGDLEARVNGRVLSKTISASPGLQWLSGQRMGSVAAFLLHPLELPFFDPAINSIAVIYPSATVFNMPWLLWFSIASVVGAILSGLVQRTQNRYHLRL